MIGGDIEDQDLARVAEATAENPDDARRIWQDIIHDIDVAGPLARLLLEFRREANDALVNLATCERHNFKTAEDHSAEITALQALVRHSIRIVEVVRDFREQAKALEANDATDIDRNTLNKIMDE